MLVLDKFNAGATHGSVSEARDSLMRALDMDSLWQACAQAVPQALPCHSCSLMFDIDDYEPRQGCHFLVEDAAATPVTSLAVSAPYLVANPRVRWYTFSQIALEDPRAAARLHAQDPTRDWREFIHMAFWRERRLEAVLSIRIRADYRDLSRDELAFLGDLYPVLDAGLRRVRSLQSERIRHKAFEALMHDLPLATAVVDTALSLIYLSPEARRQCAPWAMGEGRSGRLPAPIERAVWKAMQDQSPTAMCDTVEISHPGRDARMRVQIGQPLELAPGRRHFILTFVPVATASSPSSARQMALMRRLSPGERKVATLVLEGMRNEEIAQILCRSRKTVESHISSIYRKLDVESRAQMIRLFA